MKDVYTFDNLFDATLRGQSPVTIEDVQRWQEEEDNAPTIEDVLKQQQDIEF